VVHGVRTLSLPQLPNGWDRILAEKAPDNTRILGYDADLAFGEEFRWQLLHQRSASLLSALIQEYRTNAVCPAQRTLNYRMLTNKQGYKRTSAVLYRTCSCRSNRQKCRATSYHYVNSTRLDTMANTEQWSQTLLEFSQRADYDQYTQRTRGIIFLATPHITDANDASARKLAGIIHHEMHRYPKALVKPNDLQAFATCSRRFTELNLRCQILSCCEKVEVRTKTPVFSRRILVTS